MNNETQLLQHVSLDELEGLTIRRVIESPQGRNGRDVDFVFIFEDNSWCAIRAEQDGDGGAHTIVDGHSHDIATVCKPMELLNAGLINMAQMELLERKEAERVLAKKRAEIDYHRKKIESLEKANPNLVFAN